jgi:hypothetical protein
MPRQYMVAGSFSRLPWTNQSQPSRPCFIKKLRLSRRVFLQVRGRAMVFASEVLALSQSRNDECLVIAKDGSAE